LAEINEKRAAIKHPSYVSFIFLKSNPIVLMNVNTIFMLLMKTKSQLFLVVVAINVKEKMED